MPTDPVAPLGAEQFAALVEAVRAAVGEAVSQPVLIAQEKVPAFLGLSRSAFFRLKSGTGFPREVHVDGAGVFFRRADLERWAERLKASRPGRSRRE